ncbi:right-handed parallel beta-helix repeat-containing protein [Polluticoccus soli]|uniref:right-handed parallel beta-helix repeat-containing protein n=1 Tax=Polluticoccus soli TaxID=3034150 RepID=UPI0023E116A7|nr:right-handed parallel beta-helix repeat-containing protein [Flavipsychrobacter sp. JY13-12]
MKHFNNLRQLCLVSLLLALSAIPAFAQPLSGTYTIGGSSPNYATLAAAAADLNKFGVSGPVIFNIRDGIYTGDQALINLISGANPAARVTFKSESGNKANVVFNFGGSSTTNNYIFRLNNASYVTIRDLTMNTSGTTYGTAVDMPYAASFDSVANCNMNAAVTTTTSQYMSLVYMYQNTGSNNVVAGNAFTNGSAGVYMYGIGNTTLTKNHVITNNTFTNPYYYGVYMYYHSNVEVSNNTITASTPYSTFYPVYSYYGYNALKITGNNITVNTTGSVYGYYLQYSYGDPNVAASRGLIANNNLTINATTGTVYPYYCYYNDFATFNNNTSNATVTTGSIYNYIGMSTNSLTVTNNTINSTASGTSNTIYGLYASAGTTYVNGTIAGNKVKVINPGTSSSSYGLFGSSLINYNIYNNVVDVNTAGTNNGSLYLTSHLGNVYNNTFHSSGTGASTNRSGYVSNSGTPYYTTLRNNVFSRTTNASVYSVHLNNCNFVSSDYNNIYTAGTNLIQRTSPSTINATTLQQWRNGAMDLNSISNDPGYISTTNLAPDPANANSWSLNGRGVHMAGNNADINGAARVTTTAAGVPDIGAYEFTPTATPPAATPTPASPVASGTQVFTFGQDTVATIAWGASVPASITVRQYTGTLPPGIAALNPTSMYFYTDINVPSGTFAHTSNLYYQDPWIGTTVGGTDNGLRLAKKDGSNPWVGYAPPASTANIGRNIITTTGTNNFGLHTGIDAGLNAGVTNITDPAAGFCQGTVLVKADVKNFGTTPINTVQIQWSVDGVAQAPVNYASTIAPGATVNVSLGSVTFAGPARVIKAWTNLPNGLADGIAYDDTTTVTRRAALNGIYTIGGTTPSYATVAAALTDLHTLGVCGPVTFNIRTGTYASTQMLLRKIPGVSAVNRVTFQAETGVAANVTLSFAGSSTANNYVVRFDSARYVTVRNLTLSNTGTTYGHTVEFYVDASDDSVVNCVLNTPTTTSTSTDMAVVFSNPNLGSNLVLHNNTLNNGSYGIYWFGFSLYAPTNDLTISNNNLVNQYYMGTYLYNIASLKLRNNTIPTGGTTYSTFYGYYIYNTNRFREISGNSITKSGTASYYGLYNGYYWGDAANPAQRGVIRNNTINITSTSATQYGLYNYYDQFDTVRNNTITMTNSYSSGYNYMYLAYYSNDVMVRDNQISMTATSTGYYNYLYGAYYSERATLQGNTITMTNTSSGLWYNYAYIISYSNNCAFNNNTLTLNNNYYQYLYMTNYSHNCTFANNAVTMNQTGSYYNYNYGMYYSNNCQTNNNTFTYIQASTGTNYQYTHYYNNFCKFNGNTITANTTSGTTYLYANYMGQWFKSNNNTINATSTTGTVVGWYNYSTSTYYDGEVAYNKVNATSTSGTVYGYYHNYTNGAHKVHNNVFVAKSTGTSYAMYIRYCYGGTIDVYNNTFHNASTGGTPYVLYSNQESAYPGVVTYNNNVFSRSFNTTLPVAYIYDRAYNKGDYNNYYSPGATPNIGQLVLPAAGTYSSMQQWRNATQSDYNSLSYDPGYLNPAANDYRPDVANPAAWSMHGRGMHIVGNSTDLLGNPRPVTKAAGVPDLGAYEFVPTSTPPAATATPAAPAAGTTQVFTLGQDTVATIDWDATATVPASVTVRQYSGIQPPSFIASNPMYIYTDIQTPSVGHLHTTKFYYKDPQTGLTAGESGLRLAKKDGVNPWVPYTSATSTTNPVLNINTTTSLTDFGLHTLTDVPNNASVASLVAPTTIFCAPSTQTVIVKIKNTGNNILNTVKVGWTKDNVLQTPITITTPINTINSPSGYEVNVTLGNINFPNSNAVNFVVWTYDPNNTTDPAPVDDTLKFYLKSALNGTYTIGGTTPDYTDVVTAVNELNQFGVCGPVVFNIRDGNYTDAGKINSPLKGSSAINRVTFQSESGVAGNVVITHAATGGADNFVFGLENINYITLRKIKMVATNATNATVVNISGSSSFDSVVGCILQAPTVATTAATAAVIGSATVFTGTDNVILKNQIMNGSCGIYWNGNTSGVAARNIIDSNAISGQYYYGTYLYYTYGTKFRGNTLNMTSTSAAYGLYMYYNAASGTTPTDIIGNTINYAGNSYGLYVYYPNINGSNTIRGKMANNKISLIAPSGVYNYFMYPYYMDIYDNDIVVTGPSYAYNYMGYYAQYCNMYRNKAVVTGGYGYAWSTYNSAYSKFYNNTFVGNFGSGSTGYGCYGYYMGNDTMYNNTTLVTSTYSTSYAAYFYWSGYNNNYLRNNVFANYSNLPGALGMWYYIPTTPVTLDYNNYYAASGNHISNNGVTQSLQTWRTAVGQDMNSLCYDPGVVSPTSDAHPDPNNPASWSLNGRGVHINGNNVDLENNARVTTQAAGVPDIGAYEFVPNTVPPKAAATPAVPAVGKQVFTFGQDTVAVLDWKPNSQIPNTVDVRQYTGTIPPSFPTGANFMYFYTDVNAANSTYDFTSDIYYKDPWRGTIATEGNIRMVKKLNPQPWQAYNSPLSSVDVNRNIIRAGMTNLGYMTGIEDGTLFSAIITPGGSGIFCPGGSVVLSANTGIGYTYQWQFNYVDVPGATGPTFTASAAGDYTVKITNSSNVTATSLAFLVTIVAPPAAQVSASGPLTYCTGGNLTLSAATALNQSYQWYLNGNLIPSATQPTYQVNTHGNYTVMVKGMGCSSTSPIIAVTEGPIQVNLGQDTAFCEGTPFVLDAGFPGAKYLWSTGDTTQQITIYNKLQSGTYTVAVDAGPNCKGSDNIQVTVHPLPTVLGISYVKNGSTYQFSPSGPTDVKNYLWMFSDNTTDTAKTATHTFSIPEFEVRLVVFNDCGTDTAMLKLPVSVGETANGDVQFTVYPNPASDYVTLTSTGDVKFSDVVIINAVGQVVYRGDADMKQKEEVSVSSFANGHYLIRATTAAGMTITKPFNVVK